MSASASTSWAADTVTVCAIDQSPVVNVRLAGSTVTSEVPGADGVIVTVPVGSEVSFTVYVPLPPSATGKVLRETLTPRVSSSVIVSVAGVTVRP